MLTARYERVVLYLFLSFAKKQKKVEKWNVLLPDTYYHFLNDSFSMLWKRDAALYRIYRCLSSTPATVLLQDMMVGP